MPEYLRALHERFTTASPEAEKIQKELNRILARLRGRLGKSQRVLLLHLLDLEDDLRGQTSLDSFLSGIRLARGIEQELSEIPPYSFDGENEEQARQNSSTRPTAGPTTTSSSPSLPTTLWTSRRLTRSA